MTPEQYNKSSFNRGVWTLEDLPKAWDWNGVDWVSLTQHVYAYQKEHGLIADGKIGPQTIASIRYSSDLQPKGKGGEKPWPDGRKSAEKLATCHQKMFALILGVKEDPRCPFPFTVLCGHRGQEEQDDAFYRGTSKVKWPNGAHNSLPSYAVDIAPFPYPPEEELEEKTEKLARFVKKKALELGIRINAGVDWGWDYFHFELKDR